MKKRISTATGSYAPAKKTRKAGDARSAADESRKDELSLAKMALESMGDAVAVTDSSGRIAFLNSAAKKYAGPESSKGALLREVFDVPPPDGPLPTPRSFARDSAPRRYGSITLKTQKGGVITAEACLAPILDGKKRIRGLVFRFRDNRADIAQARIEAERQKIEALGNLAQGLASEITNWLGAIEGHASAILDNLIPKTRAHDEAQQILSVANQARTVAKRLQSIARASNVNGAMRIEAVPVAQVVNDAVNLVASSLRHQHISFSVRQPNTALRVRADAGLLLDCLVNLFLNSADALDEGGSISVDVSDTTVSSERFVLIRVRDNGRGIPRDVQDEIFRPFFTTKKASGTYAGLGLTIVKSSVEKWGGFVKLRSTVGKGTTFKIFIPMVESPAPPAPEESARAAGSGETVLVVDDDGELLREAAAHLQRAGYRVLEASNADEALAKYRENHDAICALVIDMIMSGKDGKYLLDEILRIDPNASVVVTSGFCKDFVRGYLQRGAWLFLQKPYDPDQLVSVVRKAVELRSGAQVSG